jgi:DNA-binding transcriptional ArsR family regulator
MRLKAMMNPELRKILQCISDTPKTVTEIFIELRKEQGTISGYLAYLRSLMLVRWERQGKHIYYSADVEEIERCNEAVIEFLEN